MMPEMPVSVDYSLFPKTYFALRRIIFLSSERGIYTKNILKITLIFLRKKEIENLILRETNLQDEFLPHFSVIHILFTRSSLM